MELVREPKVTENKTTSSSEIIYSENFKKKFKRENPEELTVTSERSCKEESPIKIFVAGTAFDNVLILKEIFKHLSPTDLRSCCEVNKTWRFIADPMIFDYQMTFRGSDQVLHVKTTKGYNDPDLEMRESSLAAETDYLLNIKTPFFIDMVMKVLDVQDRPIIRMFLTQFGPMVYKAAFDHVTLAHSFCSFLNATTYRTRIIQDGVAIEFVEVYYSLLDNSRLRNVQQLYLGSCGNISKCFLKASRIFQLMPNVQEIHGVPFTMVPEFKQIEKLHVLSSIAFYNPNSKKTQDKGMKSLVEARLKLQFLNIGIKMQSQSGLKFIERHKEHFEFLLKQGKNTLEHLMIRALEPQLLIKFPCKMPALRHITLRGRGFCGNKVYFAEGQDLSKSFPNLDTISFVDFISNKWAASESWCSPDGMFFSDKFREGIKFLKSNVKLEISLEKKLLEKFPSVKMIEIITADCNGDEYMADVIIRK